MESGSIISLPNLAFPPVTRMTLLVKDGMSRSGTKGSPLPSKTPMVDTGSSRYAGEVSRTSTESIGTSDCYIEGNTGDGDDTVIFGQNDATMWNAEHYSLHFAHLDRPRWPSNVSTVLTKDCIHNPARYEANRVKQESIW